MVSLTLKSKKSSFFEEPYFPSLYFMFSTKKVSQDLQVCTWFLHESTKQIAYGLHIYERLLSNCIYSEENFELSKVLLIENNL